LSVAQRLTGGMREEVLHRKTDWIRNEQSETRLGSLEDAMYGKAFGMFLMGVALCQIPAGWAQSDARRRQEPVKLIESIRGPELFRSYCAVYHGIDAKGKGPMAPAQWRPR
jgi:hypothetical protein